MQLLWCIVALHPSLLLRVWEESLKKIKDIRGSSKTSTRKQDVDDISQELVVHWNGPVISQCESLVKQALNLHFQGGSWHFAATDVRSKLHKVSKVIDRLNQRHTYISTSLG